MVAPDPLTVPLDAVGRPEHYRAMAASGFELWANSSTKTEEAGAAGVECRHMGTGSPTLPDPQPKRVDVAVVGDNRWFPLAQTVLDDLEATAVVIPSVRHATMLRLLGEARLLLWPSRIEGTSRIQREARAMGTVPVALRSNRYAEGLTEEQGAVLVDDVRDLPGVVRALLSDGDGLRALSERGIRTAQAQADWASYVKRVDQAVSSPAPADPLRPARAGMGSAVAAHTDRMVEEGAARLAEAEAGFSAFRQRRSVRAAARASDVLTRVLGR